MYPDEVFKSDYNNWSRCESKLNNAKLRILRGMEEEGSFSAVKNIQCGTRRIRPWRFENPFGTSNKITLVGGGHKLGNHTFEIKVCGWRDRT